MVMGESHPLVVAQNKHAVSTRWYASPPSHATVLLLDYSLVYGPFYGANMLQKLKQLYNAMPLPVQQAWSAVPFSWRMGSVYRQTRQLLRQSETWSQQALEQAQFTTLRETLQHAGNTVPYYRDMFSRLHFKPSEMQSLSDLRILPLLNKDDVRENIDSFLSEEMRPHQTYRVHTGGSSGVPFSFWMNNNAYAKEWAFLVQSWERAGYQEGDRKATFRGVVLPNPEKRVWAYNPIYQSMNLSTFQLKKERLEEYIDALRRFRPHILHGYPSAMSIVAKYILEKGISDLPPIKAAIAASESILTGQRELIESAFSTRFFSFYGQSERVIFASEGKDHILYDPHPLYGVTELVDKEGNPIEEAGITGELIGTGFLNRAMPFMRYRTGDMAAWVDEPTEEGRVHRRLTHIEGGRNQEHLLTADKRPISMTALNMHSNVFERVHQFQFYQDEPGIVVLRIVPAQGWTEQDTTAITKAILNKMGNDVDLQLKQVATIERTLVGKTRFIEQKLDLTPYL
jgi:phenylacetate-CoA ligase